MSIETVTCSQCKKDFSINPVSGVPVLPVCPVCAPKINRGISAKANSQTNPHQEKDHALSKHSRNT